MNTITSVWADAPKGGAVIGAIVTMVLYIRFWLAPEVSALGGLFTMAEFFAVGYCLYYFSKLRGRIYGNWGYTYGQSMSYILVMMLFAGFIYGVGYYFLVNYVAPGYFEDALDQAYVQIGGFLGGMFTTDENIEATMRALRNPLYWIFYGVMAMVIYGGIVGLFVSIFVKRPPETT